MKTIGLKPIYWVSALASIAGGTYFFRNFANTEQCFSNETFPLVYQVRFTEENVSANELHLAGKVQDSSVAAGVFDAKLTLTKQATTDKNDLSSNDNGLVLIGKLTPESLREPQGTHANFKSFQKPFAIVLNRDCQIASIETDGRESVSSRSMAHRLVSLIDLGILLTKAKSINRSDDFGKSLFETEKATFNPLTLSATRKQVEANPAEVAPGQFVAKNIVSSDFSFAQESKGTLFNRIAVNEVFDGFYKHKSEKRRISYSIVLEKILSNSPTTAIETQDLLPASSPFRVSKKPEQKYQQQEKTTAYDNSNDEKTLQENPFASYEEMREKILELLNTDRVKAKRLLLAYLRANPNAVLTFKNELANGFFEADALADLVFVFAKIGTPEAQSLMGEMINDEGISINLRLRMVFAVADIPSPSNEIIAALKQQTDYFSNSSAELGDMNSSAFLAMGTAGRNARDVTPEVENQVRNELNQALKAARNERERANVLDAIGNFGDPGFIPQVEQYLASPHTAERSAAFEAFSRIPSVLSEQKVAAGLNSETDPWVKAYGIRSLKNLGISNENSLKAIKNSYTDLREPQTRIDAIETLGQAKNLLPGTNEAILEIVQNETDAQVIEAAGRHLSAQEISAAIRKKIK